MEESRFGKLSSKISNLQKQSSNPLLRAKRNDTYLMQLYQSSNVPLNDGGSAKRLGGATETNLNTIGVIANGMNYGQSEARSII